MKKSTESGFIALFSVIMISFVLLSLALTENFSMLFSRSNALGNEYKTQSENLSYACMSTARLQIIKGVYTEDKIEKLVIGDDSCEYVIHNANKITTHACKNHTHTFYEATFDPDTPNIMLSDFTELPNSPWSFDACI